MLPTNLNKETGEQGCGVGVGGFRKESESESDCQVD